MGKAHAARHWLTHKITSFTLLFFSLWFVYSAFTGFGAGKNINHYSFTEWVSTPINTWLLIIMFPILFYHGQLNLQIVIDDYVHHQNHHKLAHLGLKLTRWGLTIASIWAVLEISMKG